MIRAVLASVLLLATFLLSPSASAQLNDPCSCNAGLVPEVLKFTSNTQVQLAFLQQIDQKQFEEIKKGGSASGNYLGIISGSANYNEFQQKRNELFSKTSFNLSVEESQSLLFSTVKTDAWGQCKKQCIQSQTGFNCDISEATSAVVAASCSWRPEGHAGKRTVSIVANAKALQSQEIEPNTMRSWQIARDPKTDLLLTFTLTPGSSAPPLRLAAVPIILPAPPKPVQLGYCVGKGGQDGVNLWGPLGETCNGIPAWGPYLTSGQPQPSQVCSCIGHGGFEGVRLWGPQGDACGGIPAWGTYSEQCAPTPTLAMCGCIGKGNILDGHVLWGPKDAACGGMPNNVWGKYASYCVAPK